MKLPVIDLNEAVAQVVLVSGKHFVYALTDPEQPKVWHYVGVTASPLLRIAQHITREHGTSASPWVSELISRGKVPVMVILEMVDQRAREEREAYWINEGLMRRYPLRNGIGSAARELVAMRHAKERPLSPARGLAQESGEKLLDAKDLAESIGMHPVTLAKLRQKGLGPPYLKIGRVVRYRLSEVLAWLSSGRRDA